MFKTLQTLCCLLSLLVSIELHAQDNLTLNRYSTATAVPDSFSKMAGGATALANQTYLDDDRKSRTDKKYYTISHSYTSSYKLADVKKLLDPADGRLGSLFNDTSVNKASGTGQYNVAMLISTPLKDFDCQSVLSFSKRVEGAKEIYNYVFTNFNMVFTKMAIQIEVQDSTAGVKIKFNQISAMKGSTYEKLNTYWAVGRFEKALKSNVQKLKSGVGGH